MSSKTVRPFVISDTETGGLKSTKNALAEIALTAITGDTLQEIGRYEAKVEYGYDPTLTYEQRALDVNGLTVEDLILNGKNINLVCNEVIAVFEKANATSIGKFSKCVLVGHNFGFDVAFYQALFQHCKKDLSKYVMGYVDHYGKFQPFYIDTQFLAWMKWQDDDTMNDFKLGTVIEKSGLELSDAHRAMNDVLANKDLFIRFVNDFRVDNSGMASVASNRQRFREHFQF